MTTIRVNGTSLYYEEQGAGPGIIFVQARGLITQPGLQCWIVSRVCFRMRSAIPTPAPATFPTSPTQVSSRRTSQTTRRAENSPIFKTHPDYTPAQLHTAEVARTLPLAVGALITIGL
jgi:hypothetical protein